MSLSSKRKRLEVQEIATDESGQSEPETSVVAGSSLRKHKDDVAVTAGKSNKRTLVSTGDSGRGILPKAPTADFDRLKEASPAKKSKKEETVLHTVDVKSVKELPETCEVMDVALQDPMMKPIYALDLPKLKRGQVTTWSSNEGSGMFMLSHYPGHQPEIVHSKGHYINPARIDPRLLEARSPVYARDGPRKRWVLSVNARPAVCVSVVNAVQSSVQQIKKLGSPEQKGMKSSSSVYRKQTYTAPTDSLNYDDDIPVYDGRHTGFDASVDLALGIDPDARDHFHSM
ncbi:hypothetical protein B0H14DRAFT_3782364 [Mycena olivaceomarginata]|nr:hypothetical protein B0H14DRAFT_3782364 [Mycena olivaceomarginata]